MKDWGAAVQWCRMFDRNGDFCRFCLLIHNLWYRRVLGINPTFTSKK